MHPCIKSTCPKGKCTKDKCPKGKSPKGKCLRGSSKCSIGQLFKGLSFLDGGSKWQNVFPVFPDFRTSRFRNPKTAYEVLILRSRPISRHLDDDRATSGCRDLHPRSSYLREMHTAARLFLDALNGLHSVSTMVPYLIIGSSKVEITLSLTEHEGSKSRFGA